MGESETFAAYMQSRGFSVPGDTDFNVDQFADLAECWRAAWATKEAEDLARVREAFHALPDTTAGASLDFCADVVKRITEAK